MFLVESFRDYLDYIHMAPNVVNGGEVGLLEFIKGTIIYGSQSIIGLIWYIISFQWVFGFTEFPIVLRESYTSVIQGEPLLDSNIELSFNQGIFTFLETSNSHSNNFVTGLLNSFFLAVPGTVSQLLTLRLFLINGVPSALFSALGMWIGQFTFLTCVLFGLEFILLPWIEFQPLVMAIGAYIVIKTVHRTWYTDPYVQEKEKEGFASTNRESMFDFFRTTLCLSWCEQMCMFSSLANVTLTAGSTTLLQTSDSNFFFSTFGYLIGLTVGSVLWTVLWAFIGIWVRSWFFDLPSFLGPFRITYREFLLYFHRAILITAISFSVVTFPYYGADYVIGNVLGFSAEDHNLTAATTPSHIELEAKVDWRATPLLKQPFGLTPTSVLYDFYDPNSDQTEVLDAETELNFLVAPMDSRAQSRISLAQLEEHTYGPDKRILNLRTDRELDEGDDSPLSKFGEKAEQFLKGSNNSKNKRGESKSQVSRKNKETQDETTNEITRQQDEDRFERDNNDSELVEDDDVVLKKRSTKLKKDKEQEYNSPFDKPYVFSPYVSKKVQDYENKVASVEQRLKDDENLNLYKRYRVERNAQTVLRPDDLDDYRFRIVYDMTREEMEKGKAIYERRESRPPESSEDKSMRYGITAAKKGKNFVSFGYNPEQPIERIINYLDRPDEYSLSLNSDEEQEDLDLDRQALEVPILFRDKYFSNPVWNLFLKLDMYSFLLGQSPDQAVTAAEERELFDHRHLVQTYANGLIDFKESDPKNMNFAKLVTNNQFKGSLDLLKEYKFANFHEQNAETVSDQGLNPELKVLKYDQAFFHNKNKEDFMFHEELQLDEDKSNYEKDEKLNQSSPTERTKRFLKRKQLPSFTREDLTQEDLDQSVPMYIGWDGNLRKFLVKTNISPNEIYTADEIRFDPNTIGEQTNGDFQGNSFNGLNGQEDTETVKQQYEKYAPYFGIETSPPKKDIPDYYSFQAWSKAVENIPLGDHLSAHLPGANYTPKQKYMLKIFFELLYDDYRADVETHDEETDRDVEQRELSETRKDRAADILDRLPNYNWFWLRRSAETAIDPLPLDNKGGVVTIDLSEEPKVLQEKYKNDVPGLLREKYPELYASQYKKLHNFNTYFKLGNSVPPKLRGLAWPGVKDPSLAEPFVDTATRNLNKQYDNRDIFNLEAQKTLAEEKIIRDEKRQKENERKYDANQKRIKEKEIEMEQEKKKQDRKRKS